MRQKYVTPAKLDRKQVSYFHTKQWELVNFIPVSINSHPKQIRYTCLFKANRMGRGKQFNKLPRCTVTQMKVTRQSQLLHHHQNICPPSKFNYTA